MSSNNAFDIPIHVVARQIGGETVILNLESGTYFGLNAVGARIWELIGEGKSVNEVRSVMLAEFEVSEDVLDRDLERLLCDLRNHELLLQR
jgi:hypothetical protein